MAMGKTTTRKTVLQPQRTEKPRADFPLTVHRGGGQWCKKIKGRIHYFGKLDDPETAEKIYNSKIESIKSGTKPRAIEVITGRVDVGFACNAFLHAKKKKLESGDISERTWKELKDTCEFVLKVLKRERLVSDLRADDFDELRRKMAKRFGPVRLGNEVYRVRSVFKYALKAKLISEEVEYGPEFTRPAKRLVRLNRAKMGPRMFTAEQCLSMLKKARPALRAFILLGLNGGFVARDCGTLPRAAIDLEAGFIDYARPKTGVQRRVPLWPETVAAIRETMATSGELAFLTTQGTPYAKDEPGNDPIGLAFRRLLVTLKLNREGLGYATLRHIFQTIGEQSLDFPAVRAIMGHVDDSISDVYREDFMHRLKAVTETVHLWLYGKSAEKR